MKKINKNLSVIAALILLSLRVSGEMHMIMVSDFSFAPNNLTVQVGDTIEWMWGNGNHTTTSTSVPPGAVAWDQPINSGSAAFDYVVIEPGTYQYKCTPHESMGMTGQFTAMNPTGIAGQVVLPYLNIDGNLTSGEMKLKYNFNEVQILTLNVFSVIGTLVKSIYVGSVPAGKSEKLISLGGIPKGVYIVELAGSNINITRKITVQ